jgi:hypothetical protein
MPVGPVEVAVTAVDSSDLVFIGEVSAFNRVEGQQPCGIGHLRREPQFV